MNIAFDLRPAIESPHGGIGRVTLELATVWRKTYPEDRLIFFTSGWKKPILPARLAVLMPEHQHIQLPNKILNLSFLLGINSLSEVLQKQISNLKAIFLPNLTFIGKRNPANISFGLLIHDLSFLLEPRWYSWTQRMWHHLIKPTRLIQTIAHRFAVSQRTITDIQKLIGYFPVQQIPLGPTDVARQIKNPHQSNVPRSTILVFGKHDRRKNAQGAARAIQILQQNPIFSTYALTYASGSDTELALQIQSAAAILIPSWYEGYSFPLHEAATAGIPAVCGIAGASPETAPPGTYFAPATKPHLIAAALQLALQSPPHPPLIPNELRWITAVKQIREKLLT